MYLRYNYRLDPTPSQRASLMRALGCARLVYNDGLRARRDAFAADKPFAKIGGVKVRWSRALPSAPSSVTIIKDASGRFHASFLVESDPSADARRFPDEPHSEVGIDLGLAHFAVLSDGTKIDAPRYLRAAARRVKKLQRALSRKKPGSADRRKQSDAGWSTFLAMLEYKAARHGRRFARIDRYEPTSRTCSACGLNGGPKPLGVREWTCTECGARHDRDVNAAKNILAAGQADRLNACGARVRPRTTSAALRGEARTL